VSDLLTDDLPPDLQALIDSLPDRSVYEQECEVCGGAFIPKRPWGRFCSGRCRLRAWRKAQRAA
jgi:uncharacterized OB-fold protein